MVKNILLAILGIATLLFVGLMNSYELGILNQEVKNDYRIKAD